MTTPNKKLWKPEIYEQIMEARGRAAANAQEEKIRSKSRNKSIEKSR